MTKIVIRKSRMKNGKRVRARIYSLIYRLPEMQKRKTVSLGTTDKQVAERKADDFLRELQQEGVGIIPPKMLRESAAQPLTKHLEDYAADLQGAGRDAAYIYNVGKAMTKLCAECGWKLPKDITADSFQAWRAKQTKAAKTLKDYLCGATAFVQWMVRNGRMAGNPLNQVSKISKGKSDPCRRAYSYDDFTRLLEVAGIRKPGYLAAMFTGLRRAELGALQWGDIHLDVEQPFISVRASTTKNGKKSEIEIHPQLETELRRIKPEDADGATPVFSIGMIASMWMLKRDLMAAGIPYKDAQGRRVDFHALRGSLNTHMALAKVDPQTRKEIMRHSDIKLTLDVYTDKTMLPTSQAIRCLPAFEKCAPIRAPHSGIFGHLVAQPVTNGILESDPEPAENECLSHELAQNDAERHVSVSGCLARTRTLTKRFRISCATITPRGSFRPGL